MGHWRCSCHQGRLRPRSLRFNDRHPVAQALQWQEQGCPSGLCESLVECPAHGQPEERPCRTMTRCIGHHQRGWQAWIAGARWAGGAGAPAEPVAEAASCSERAATLSAVILRRARVPRSIESLQTGGDPIRGGPPLRPVSCVWETRHCTEHGQGVARLRQRLGWRRARSEWCPTALARAAPKGSGVAGPIIQQPATFGTDRHRAQRLAGPTLERACARMGRPQYINPG